MLFSLKEIVKWLGMTAFEIWLHLATLLVFSVLAVLKYHEVLDSTWWTVFIPLFTCDGLNIYFCTIVFIRMYKEKEYRLAGLRLLSSVMVLVCLFVFKILLCQRLTKEKNFSYSEVFAPVFVALQILMVRACQTH